MYIHTCYKIIIENFSIVTIIIFWGMFRSNNLKLKPDRFDCIVNTFTRKTWKLEKRKKLSWFILSLIFKNEKKHGGKENYTRISTWLAQIKCEYGSHATKWHLSWQLCTLLSIKKCLWILNHGLFPS